MMHLQLFAKLAYETGGSPGSGGYTLERFNVAVSLSALVKSGDPKLDPKAGIDRRLPKVC